MKELGQGGWGPDGGLRATTLNHNPTKKTTRERMKKSENGSGGREKKRNVGGSGGRIDFF